MTSFADYHTPAQEKQSLIGDCQSSNGAKYRQYQQKPKARFSLIKCIGVVALIVIAASVVALCVRVGSLDVQGVVGPQGPPGAPGTQGPNGPRGPPGAPGSIISDDDDDSSSSSSSSTWRHKTSTGTGATQQPPVCTDDDDDDYFKQCTKQLSVAKFGLETGTSVAGKNVLIIGASRGIGCGAAQQFAKYGANVVGTSRDPSSYPLDFAPLGIPRMLDICKDESGNSLVTDTPLRLENRTSINDFFDNEPTVSNWVHIDYLILGGVGPIAGNPGISMDAFDDLFGFYNAEMIGRVAVLHRALDKLNNAPDPRAIFLSSVAAFSRALPVGGYSTTKAAQSQFVRIWNMNVEQIRTLNNPVPGDGNNRVRLLSYESGLVQTDVVFGDFLQQLGDVQPAYSFGGLCQNARATVFDEYAAFAFAVALAQGITITQAGDSLVYMATTRSDESRFFVSNPDAVRCIDDKDGAGALYGSDTELYCQEATPSSKGREPFFKRLYTASLYNNMKAFSRGELNNIITSNDKCPIDMTYQLPANPADIEPLLQIPKYQPNMCCADPQDRAPQITQTEWLEELRDDPCKEGGNDQLLVAPSSLPVVAANHMIEQFKKTFAYQAAVHSPHNRQ